jgi:long-chain fatty acid transport protein
LGGRFVFAIVILVALAPGRAAASPVELFGFGSAHGAQAGTGVATADDFAAVYYNPAGLAAGTGKQASIGFLGALSNLQVEGRRQPFEDPLGIVVGIAAPAPLGGPLAGRLRVGAGLYLLPGTIGQIVAHYPDEPFYPYYDRRQRIVILPGAGVKIVDGLWVGGAINFLAGMQGSILASEGPTRAIEARVDETVPAVARVIAGVLWAITPEIRVGATYRQRFEMAFATRADTEVAGEPIDLDLRAGGQYTPNQVAVGGAYRAAGGHVGLDVTWSNWSEYPGPFVVVESELPLIGPLAGQLPDVPFKDTIAVRTGGELAVGEAVRLRGGYGFETSPVPARQTGVTNLLDGPKHTVGLGAGFGWRTAKGKRVRLDLHVQAQLVGARTLHKEIFDESGDQEYDPWTSLRDEVEDDTQSPETLGSQISNPGYPDLDSGGQVFSGGLTLEAEL